MTVILDLSLICSSDSRPSISRRSGELGAKLSGMKGLTPAAMAASKSYSCRPAPMARIVDMTASWPWKVVSGEVRL